MQIFKPLCFLCEDYTNETLMCSKCQNRFCKDCLNDYLQIQNKCPKCQEINNNDLFVPFCFDYTKLKIVDYSQETNEIVSLITTIDNEIKNSVIEKKINEIKKQKENYIQKITKQLKIDIYQGFYLKFLLDCEYNESSLNWFNEKYQEIKDFLSKKLVHNREIEKNINLNKYTPPTYYQCRYIQIKSPTTLPISLFDKQIFRNPDIKLVFVQDKNKEFYNLSIIKAEELKANLKPISENIENFVKVTFKLFHKKLLIKKQFKYNLDKPMEKIEKFIPSNIIDEKKIYKLSFTFKIMEYNYFSSITETATNKRSLSVDSNHTKNNNHF